MKVYMPSKPAKFGLKVGCVCVLVRVLVLVFSCVLTPRRWLAAVPHRRQ